MIHGILAKYESTEQGFTVTIKCDHDQGQGILNLHKKDIVVQEQQTEIPVDRTQLFKDILTGLNAIQARLEKEMGNGAASEQKSPEDKEGSEVCGSAPVF